MPIPTWSVGQVLAAADVNSWFVDLAAFKAANTVRNNATQTADPDLVVSLAASASYDVRCQLLYTGIINWSFTVPAASTGSYGATYNVGGTGYTSVANGWTTTGSNAAAAAQQVIIEGCIFTSVTAANLTLMWATSGSATLINGSKLLCKRVA